MGREKSTIQEQKAELIARLASSRIQVGQSLDEVADRLDFTSQLRDTVRSNPWKIAAGSIGVGAVAGLLIWPGRRMIKAASGKRMPMGWIFKILFRGGLALAQPFLFNLANAELQKRVGEWKGSNEG